MREFIYFEPVSYEFFLFVVQFGMPSLLSRVPPDCHIQIVDSVSFVFRVSEFQPCWVNSFGDFHEGFFGDQRIPEVVNVPCALGELPECNPAVLMFDVRCGYYVRNRSKLVQEQHEVRQGWRAASTHGYSTFLANDFVADLNVQVVQQVFEPFLQSLWRDDFDIFSVFLVV